MNTFYPYIKNYDWKDRNGKPYRTHNANLATGTNDRTIDIINNVLFHQTHARSLEELEKFLGVVFKKQIRLIGGQQPGIFW